MLSGNGTLEITDGSRLEARCGNPQAAHDLELRELQEQRGEEMLQAVKLAFANCSHTRPISRRITVEIDGSSLVFKGRVGSFYAKVMAQESVRKLMVGSGFHLKNELKVKASAC